MESRCHPIFNRFTRWEGDADGRNHFDFLGVRTDPKYWKNIRPQPPNHLRTSYPIPHEQYFEWIFILETVFERKERDTFTVAELGAGYGPWIVRAYKAFRQFSAAPIRLIAVEGDYNHYLWALEHLRNNGIDPDQHRILHGCMTATPSTQRFLQSDESGRGLRTKRCAEILAFQFQPQEAHHPKNTGNYDGERYGKCRSSRLNPRGHSRRRVRCDSARHRNP